MLPPLSRGGSSKDHEGRQGRHVDQPGGPFYKTFGAKCKRGAIGPFYILNRPPMKVGSRGPNGFISEYQNCHSVAGR